MRALCVNNKGADAGVRYLILQINIKSLDSIECLSNPCICVCFYFVFTDAPVDVEKSRNTELIKGSHVEILSFGCQEVIFRNYGLHNAVLKSSDVIIIIII